MIKPLILSLLTLLFLSACKREYAQVQPTSVDSFVQKQRIKPTAETADKPVRPPATLESQQTEIINLELQTTDKFELENELIRESNTEAKEQSLNSTRINRSHSLLNLATPSTYKSLVQHLGEFQKKPVKQKKKPLRRWNAMIPAGFIFLGIAILLALINLNGLALLFGVASILFLFLGFKKLFRRNKRRSLFR